MKTNDLTNFCANTSMGYGNQLDFLQLKTPLTVTSKARFPFNTVNVQIKDLLDKTIESSYPVFTKIGEAATAIDQALTRVFTVFPAALAETVANIPNSLQISLIQWPRKHIHL